MRIVEHFAARRCKADAAYKVKSSCAHILQALVVAAIDVVWRPTRNSAYRLHPLRESTGLLAVRRYLEEVASAVRGDAYAVLRLRDAKKLLAPGVDMVDVVDVAVAPFAVQSLEQLRLVLNGV